MEEVKKSTADKATDWFREHVLDLAIALISITYVAIGLFSIEPTGKSIIKIVGEGALFYIVSLLISNSLFIKGGMAGKKSALFQKTMGEYSKIIDLITPKINKVEPWCEKKNQEELERVQTRILLKAGITLEDFKNIEFLKKEHTENEMLAIEKAQMVEIYELHQEELTSEINENKRAFYMGKKEAQHTKEEMRKDAITKILSTVFFAYYGFGLIKDFSWGLLFYPLLQLATIFIMGALKYVKNYKFITEDLRNRFIRKTNYLYEFKNEEIDIIEPQKPITVEVKQEIKEDIKEVVVEPIKMEEKQEIKEVVEKEIVEVEKDKQENKNE